MNENEKGVWLHFLSKWVFFLPIPVLLLFASIGILLSAAGGSPMGLAFMVAAAEKPYGLRIQGLALILLWGSMAVFFVALSKFFRQDFPVKSTMLSLCGLGFIIPMSAGNLSWTVGLDMSRRYAAATPEQQDLINEIQSTIFQVVESRIDVANLLWGVGMLLFIFMAQKSKSVPLFISILYFFSALVMLCVFFSHVFGYTFPFVLIPPFWLATLTAHIALGVTFHKKRKLANKE